MGSKAKKGDTTRAEAENVPQNTCKEIIALPKKTLKEKARAITKEEKAFSAKHALRTAWANKHLTARRRLARRRRRRRRSRSSEDKRRGSTWTVEPGWCTL